MYDLYLGAFLLCLENLYEKITGKSLTYTALIGKPSEITYRHAEHVLQEHGARIFGHSQWNPLRNMYFVGDNVCTDIFGANLYHQYLQKTIDKKVLISEQKSPINTSRSLGLEHSLHNGAQNCFSVLVETGVFSSTANSDLSLNHSPRDFLPVEDNYLEPTFTCTDVAKAVETIFNEEEFC